MNTAGGIVYLLDDEPGMVKALMRLLRAKRFDVRGFTSVRDFLAGFRPEETACLVLDMAMPELDGLALQRRLTHQGILIPIIFLTGHGDIPMTVRAMKAGAVDFLAKPFRDQEMLDAVSTALERDRVRRGEAAKLSALVSAYATLSARERQVMALVTAGKMNKQVAGELHLSEITVKIHRGTMMRKMGAKTLASLVRMAEALDLQPPTP